MFRMRTFEFCAQTLFFFCSLQIGKHTNRTSLLCHTHSSLEIIQIIACFISKGASEFELYLKISFNISVTKLNASIVEI